MYALNLPHSPEIEREVWEYADCVYQHAGQGQGTIQESDLPVPGVSDSIESNNGSGAILACNKVPVWSMGMSVQRKRRHSDDFVAVGREPV